MTNSRLEKRKETIISEDRTSRETVRYISNRDKEFKIGRTDNGLYTIEMVGGGKAPSICDSLYTGHQQAEKALVLYLTEGDRLGYAQFPGKEKNVKSTDE